MTGVASHDGRQVLGGAAADDEGEVPGSRSSAGYHTVESGSEKGVESGDEAQKVDDDLIKDDKDEGAQGGDDGRPRLPDGGWGWIVVLGSFIITVLVPVLGPCFGVLFSRYLLQEGTSSSTTAWIFNTQCFTWNMMGLLVRPLAKEFGWRNVAIVGILLTSASVIISAFSPTPEFLFFSFSLLSGVGGGLVVCMSFILVPMYFDRRRGVANAVMMSGVCIGQMAGPPLVRFLQDEYGFKGATLIIGAMMLNGLVGAALFHPVEWHMKPPRLDTKELLQKESVNLIRKGVGTVRKSEEGRTWSGNLLCGGEDKGELKLSRGPRIEAVREDGPRKTCVGGKRSQRRRRRSLIVLLVHVARSTVTDLGIFRSPRAVIISFGCTLFLNGYYNFVMMVPFAMQAAGHTLQDSAWCISVSAVCNLLARTLMSSLSDWRRFNMRGAYMAGITATAASIFVFPLLHDLPWLLVTMAVWGSGVGTTMGLYNLVMVRFMGLDNLAPVFGASSLTIGVGFLCFGPLIGVIRDKSGSYAVSMWVLSGFVFTSFILWLFMPAAQAYDQCRRAKGSQKESP